MIDVAELLRAISMGISSFEDDPADSDFQEGYLAALVELQRVLRGNSGHSLLPKKLRLVIDNTTEDN